MNIADILQHSAEKPWVSAVMEMPITAYQTHLQANTPKRPVSEQDTVCCHITSIAQQLPKPFPESSLLALKCPKSKRDKLEELQSMGRY